MTTIRPSDRRLIETLRRRQQHQYPVHRYLRSWLLRISVDPAAFDFVRHLRPQCGDEVSAETLHSISTNILRRIQAGWYRTGWCARGRYDHEIACLLKALRPYLHLDGQRLAGLDISNSQPLLFLALLAHRQDTMRAEDRHLAPPPHRPVEMSCLRAVRGANRLAAVRIVQTHPELAIHAARQLGWTLLPPENDANCEGTMP